MSQLIKFKATPSWGFVADIKAVEVERETGASVWIRGRRENKHTAGGICYFDTWEEAKSALIDSRQSDVDQCRRALELANSRLGNVRGMKKPEGL